MAIKFYTLPSGEDLVVSQIQAVTPLVDCKHDPKYNNYDVVMLNGKSYSVFEIDKPRMDLINELELL